MRSILLIWLSLFALTILNAYADTPAAATPFAITSKVFLDKGLLPVLYTCDGKDQSPQLTWTDAPAKTKTFALIVSDPDATNGPFYHWVLYNIPHTSKELTEGVEKLPSGTLVGKNSFNKMQYSGPCPPKGSSHSYLFTIYALDNKLSLTSGADVNALMQAMENHVIEKATITAVYSRWLT